MKSIHLGTCKTCKMQALSVGGLYIQVVFRAGLTVYSRFNSQDLRQKFQIRPMQEHFLLFNEDSASPLASIQVRYRGTCPCDIPLTDM